MRRSRSATSATSPMSTPSTSHAAVTVSPKRAPSASISSGWPFSVRKMFSWRTPTASARRAVDHRLQSPWTGIT
jgi:hypothetical protein